MAQPRFGKRRWRRPERMTLEHPPVMRRKDLGVSEPLTVEPELARTRSRRQLETPARRVPRCCARSKGRARRLDRPVDPFVATIVALASGHRVLLRRP